MNTPAAVARPIAFEYFEIRPCIDQGGNITSFVDEAEFARECSLLTEAEWHYSTCWAIYGRYTGETGQLLALAIGDFTEKADALTILNAILAPMAKARDALDAGGIPYASFNSLSKNAREASTILDDVINQSSNHERL